MGESVTKEELAAVLEAACKLTSILDPDSLLEQVMDTVIQILGAERGFLMLYDRETLKVHVARNLKQETIDGPSFEFSRSVIQEVERNGIPIVTSNAGADPRFETQHSVQAFHLRSIMCVPLKIKDRMTGLLYVDNKEAIGSFGEHHLDVLQIFTNQISVAIENAQLHDRLKNENIYLHSAVQEKYAFDNIIGKSQPMIHVFELVSKVLHSNAPVMILGESGTGKELIAHAVHFNGPRKEHRYLTQNCAALPESLLESEFFGHVRGAFTGAHKDRKGIFEEADKGTVFLDEIADASPALQAKMLRVVEDGEVRRIGSNRAMTVDVRIITATGKDLEKESEAGRFRRDLYYRLNVIQIPLPPLRDRREDIPLLARYFYEKYTSETGKHLNGITAEAMSALQEHNWPGNVRELQHEIERAVTLGNEGEAIAPEVLSFTSRRSSTRTSEKGRNEVGLNSAVENLQRNRIIEALARCNGNRTKTAESLGIPRRSLQKMMARLRIEVSTTDR